jgi:hypothetical protein
MELHILRYLPWLFWFLHKSISYRTMHAKQFHLFIFMISSMSMEHQDTKITASCFCTCVILETLENQRRSGPVTTTYIRRNMITLICILCQYLDYTVSSGWMINEMNRIWKAAVMSWSRYFLTIYLEGLRKTTKYRGLLGNLKVSKLVLL